MLLKVFIMCYFLQKVDNGRDYRYIEGGDDGFIRKGSNSYYTHHAIVFKITILLVIY
jgi:hypothetical protein